ncbi:MAG TPA: PAS domain-containing protein, partial [Nitrospiraceae bacterium]|nr:PAS domain-containing protein [Nitrospiraceae bacterium]
MTVPAAPISDHPSNGSPAWLPTREDISLILGASTEAIFITDQAGHIIFLNSAARQLVGRTRDVIGQEFHDLLGCLASDKSGAAQCPFTRLANTGEPVVIPSHFWNREDGTQFELP